MADWVRSKKIATKRIKMDLFKEIQKAQKQLEGVVQTTPLAENFNLRSTNADYISINRKCSGKSPYHLRKKCLIVIQILKLKMLFRHFTFDFNDG